MKSREQKRTEAQQRQAERDKLLPPDQLNVLDVRLGVGVGAKRERNRLIAKWATVVSR